MNHNKMIAVQLRNITVSYNTKPVLIDISLDVPQGTVVGILGPNGAGKSTLIKTVMGFERRDFGTVSVFGKPVEQVKGRIAYVPQRGQIDWNFPVNVRDVVLMGRYGYIPWYRSISRKDRAIADEALSDVNMFDFKYRQIGQLSGGQQQRVFMARALAQKADVLLLDEPFAGVDAVTERAIAAQLATFRDQNKTVLVVHHDLETAAEFFDRVIILNRRLYAYGEPKKVLTTQLLTEVYGGQLRHLSWLQPTPAEVS